MAVNTEIGTAQQPGKFSHRVKQKIPLLFAIWLVLTVISPLQDLYKAFFHLVIVPAVFLLVFTGQSGINWKDPFLRIALVFFGYAGIATLFIGLGPLDNQVRAFRWSVEISFGVIAMFIWMPSVLRKPEWWGRFLLWITLLGATAALLLFVFQVDFQGKDGQGRLTGLGALYNPVTMSCILLSYFALGHFLVQSKAETTILNDRALIVFSFLTICLAILLSQSRTAIAAMTIYALFIGMLALVKRPKAPGYIFVFLMGITAIGLLVGYFYGLEGYIERLLERGMSHRIELWTGYLRYLPDSWLLGFGAGTEPQFHPAAEGYWEPNQLLIAHPHNLFLGTLTDTGLIGISFLVALIVLLVKAIFKYVPTIEEKIRLFGILGLLFVLTLTGSHTIVSSIKAIWLYLWLPVIFIWFWSQRAKYPRDNI